MCQALVLHVQWCLQLQSDSLLFFSSAQGREQLQIVSTFQLLALNKHSSVPQPHQGQGNSLSTHAEARGRAQPQSPQH